MDDFINIRDLQNFATYVTNLQPSIYYYIYFSLEKSWLLIKILIYFYNFYIMIRLFNTENNR